VAFVASTSDVLVVGGTSTHQRVNPAGLVCQFVTLRRCASARIVGGPETDFTWFDGYAREIVACARCTIHLGWRYRATGGGEPAEFYGILLDRLREEDRADQGREG
jgi:cereblon